MSLIVEQLQIFKCQEYIHRQASDPWSPIRMSSLYPSSFSMPHPHQIKPIYNMLIPKFPVTVTKEKTAAIDNQYLFEISSQQVHCNVANCSAKV